MQNYRVKPLNCEYLVLSSICVYVRVNALSQVYSQISENFRCLTKSLFHVRVWSNPRNFAKSLKMEDSHLKDSQDSEQISVSRHRKEVKHHSECQGITKTKVGMP